MIAAQLDSVLASSANCYGIIRRQSDGAVWDTNAQAYAAIGSVTAANAAVAGSVDVVGRFSASEPTGFSATEVTDVSVYEHTGTAAYGDELAGLGVTHYELTASYTAVDQSTLGAITGSGDVNQETIAPERVWIVKESISGGWENTTAKTLVVGLSDDFAVDFRNAMPSSGNSYITGTPVFSIYSGTAGGVTFANEGKLKKQAKVRITAVTAGTYVIKCRANRDTGPTMEGRVTLTVIAASA